MYREDMGRKIRYLRKYHCGYSQRRLAKLVGTDIDNIRMLEDGSLKNPQPQLILNIADVLDSFYMEFVKDDYEDEFLYFLNWGTYDDEIINELKDITMLLSDIAVKMKFMGWYYERKFKQDSERKRK